MNLYFIAKDRNRYSTKIEIPPPPLSPLYEEEFSSEEEDHSITFNHVDYIKSIEKNRPLPQLPFVSSHSLSETNKDKQKEEGKKDINKQTVYLPRDSIYEDDDFYNDQKSHESQQKIENGEKSNDSTNHSLPSLINDIQELIELNRALTSPPSSPTLAPVTNNAYKTPSTLFSFDPSTIMTSSSLLENIKTYHRMATKTDDSQTQFTFAIYLISLIQKNSSASDSTDNQEKLRQEVVYWIDKLAKQNYPEALCIKASWYLHPPPVFTGIKQLSLQKALKYFYQAAKLGLTEAYYQLAEIYKEEEEQIKDGYQKMMVNYEMAASKNHTYALYKLANILLRGLYNQEKDIAMGLYYLKKAADTQENAMAAYELGCIYSNQLKLIDLDSDPQLTELFHDATNECDAMAIQYFCEAHKQGLASAGYALGEGYLKEKLGISKKDPWKAYQYYADAAEKGHEEAMLALSKFFLEGVPGHLGCRPYTAFKLCYRAAVRKQGNMVAEYTLGTYYELGIGVPSNKALAFEWYFKSASKGYIPAEKKMDDWGKKTTVTKRQYRSYIDQSMRMVDKHHKKKMEQSWNLK